MHAPDDAHVVTAVAVAADAVDAADGRDVDVAAAVRGALGRLRTARADAAGCGAVLAELLAAGGPPVLVTVLVDDAVPPAVVGDLEAVAAREAPGADVVVLPTGRPGAGVTLCVEEQED